MLQFDQVTHTYTEGGIILPHVTGLLAEQDLYKGADFFTEEGRLFGQYAHMACELADRDELDWSTLDDALAGCVRSYMLFKQATGFTPVLIEQPLSGYGVGTTPDRYGQFPDGSFADVELKAGWSPHPADQIQTALQVLILQANGYPCHHRGALYLKRDGRLPSWKPHTKRSDFDVARSIITLFNFKRSKGLI